MKTSLIRSNKFFARVGQKPMPPCKTLLEFADEFGVSWQTLSNLMRSDDSSPKHVPKGGRKTYYSTTDMRSWWKLRTGGKEAV